MQFLLLRSSDQAAADHSWVPGGVWWRSYQLSNGQVTPGFGHEKSRKMYENQNSRFQMSADFQSTIT